MAMFKHLVKITFIVCLTAFGAAACSQLASAVPTSPSSVVSPAMEAAPFVGATAQTQTTAGNASTNTPSQRRDSQSSGSSASTDDKDTDDKDTDDKDTDDKDTDDKDTDDKDTDDKDTDDKDTDKKKLGLR